MNKLMKVIPIVGNLCEVIIASSIVADLLLKFRGKKSTTTPKPIVVEEANPQPQAQPDAAV